MHERKANVVVLAMIAFVLAPRSSGCTNTQGA
jgi:hypothetical protein